MNLIQRVFNLFSVQNASNICARWLASKVPNTKHPTVKDQIEVLSYGFQIPIGALVKGFLLIGLSLILGVTISALIITLTFSSFRILGGGYHAKKFNTCMIISLSTFLLSALLAQNTYSNWSNINVWSMIVLCVMTGLYIIYKYVPRDTPNKPITKETEKRKFKRWCYFYLIGWIILVSVCFVLGWKLVVISSCFGLLLELFSISDWGVQFYTKIESSHN